MQPLMESADDVRAARAPVFPVPNTAAQTASLPMPLPSTGGPGPAYTPPSAPMQGEILPPLSGLPIDMPPAAGGGLPTPANLPAAPGDDRDMLRQMGMALLHGNVAQRVQGLQLISKARQLTDEEQGSRERQRLMNVIDVAPVDEATKHRAAIVAQLGAKPEDVVKALGFDQTGVGGPGGMGGATGDDFLKTLPSGYANMVKSASEGRLPITASYARSKQGLQFIQSVSQYDPTFDAIDYQTRAGVRKAFTSGKEGRDLNALSTAIQHVGLLSDKAEELDNYSAVGPGGLLTSAANIGRNTVKGLRQDPTVNTFNTARDKVAEEFTRLYRGSGGNEADIQREVANLNAANSPPQLRQAMRAMTDLAMGKMQALSDQYNSGMGTSKDALGVLADLHPRQHAGTAAAIAKIDQRAAGGSSAPVAVSSEDDYNALPPGTRFVGPDGHVRRKP